MDSPQRAQIPKIRDAGWLCLTATGLNIIGGFGFDLFTLGVPNWRNEVEKLATIDWKRTADIWQGNVIQNNRLITQTVPVRNAIRKMELSIGFDVEKFKQSEYMKI